MLTIRLQRTGKKNRPDFRIILAEKTAAASKKFVEILGSYNPRTKAFTGKIDRINYWISQHVTLSPTAQNLLINNKILNSPKVRAFSVPKKPPVAEEKVEKVVTTAPVGEVTEESSPSEQTEVAA